MSEKRTVPLYQRYSANGQRLASRAGVEAALKAGDDAAANSATWLVRIDSLGGLVPRAEFDVVRDTAGRWWTVKEVGALVDGVYPLKCELWKDGGQ